MLTHLVHLEDKQRYLLQAVVKGDLLSCDQLEAEGVQWPAENKTESQSSRLKKMMIP